ncbi:thiamine pyrophosphokinase [Thermosyntropha lipolytica DSM 11003]|uniref:Thiamine diphosphokinase n=1 Tax=Thermosyntropha lipolytica DSM 11003 TaxID=1123382 RepID=A0A1M5LXQ2_9FIRM|nr:thiamine diphosphokinase [Thermosyntropha lipolytica]SHG69882.1 thiamine pyrophosphokinase [Thermosyntropha lipolytica DSM 11003]
MKCVIMANGEYGKVEEYKAVAKEADLVFCADGGANYAYKAGIKPWCIVGDMDSIGPEVKDFYQSLGVIWRKYPRNKDFTDTQLALALAEEKGAREIIFLGTLGGRLDHALSNLYAGMEYVKRGVKIKHYAPSYVVYLTGDKLEIEGKEGDIVSLLALSDKVQGVWIEGFEYPLSNADLEKGNPYAISNVLKASRAYIKVGTGVLAVIHYHQG